MILDKEIYKVFEIDIATEEYSIDCILVGANDKEDLVKNLPNILKGFEYNKKKIKKIIENDFINEIDNLYTDKPYFILNRVAYYE